LLTVLPQLAEDFTLSTLPQQESPEQVFTEDTGWGVNWFVSSNVGPDPFSGLNINEFLGADRFYGAGFTGANAIVGNVEAGHVWNGHESLGHVTTLVHDTVAPGPQTGQFDRHATWVGATIGGRLNGPAAGEYQRGIAYGANLWSGAIATQWVGVPYTGNFNFNTSTFITPYKTFFVNGVGGQTADVVNSSWGFTDPSGSSFGTFSRGIDALVNLSGKTFVAAAGNSGPGTNTVGAPAAGYNAISVASLGADTNVPPYNTVSSFSSRGPNSVFIPADANGSSGTTINAARAAVDIAAPGQNLTLAFYGGATGGNTGGSSNPATNFYSFNVQGTSFAAPTVAGGATLVAGAARTQLGGGTKALDGRVIQAMLQNSADKVAGWSNAQANIGGVITTTQSLDYVTGAGRMNLDRAYDQLFAGATDVTGLSGGAVPATGWDFGQVSQGTPNDYFINEPLVGGTPFTATLTWHTDRDINLLTDATTEVSFDDLNLQIWQADSGGSPTTLIAESKSLYNNVEHLSFTVPTSGHYLIRTVWSGEHWDFTGDVNNESYGLAWSCTPQD
jgi:hypothetical protein